MSGSGVYEVTGENILDGTPCDGDLCPIALSYNDSNSDKVEVYEDYSMVYSQVPCHEGGELYKIMFRHDEEVRDWIKDYDAGCNVLPITVEFSIDDTSDGEVWDICMDGLLTHYGTLSMVHGEGVSPV
tara:strand:- start:369 stop:752 length:384 start_codon:yes stop_codon:yes gene_type:complete